jgi:hypothetical protein
MTQTQITLTPIPTPDAATTPLQHVTALDRGLDVKLPSNLFALVAALGAGSMVAARRGSITEIISSAGWVFSTWALGRELDPDRPLTASAASSAAVIALLGIPEARSLAFTALSATGVLMLAARAGLNSTGRALKIGDEVLIATAPSIAQLLTGAPLGGLGVASLAALHLRRGRWWSVTVAGLGVVAVFFTPARGGNVPMALAAAAIGVLSSLRRVPSSRNDADGAYDPQSWRVMQTGVGAGAAIAALLSPPLVLGSLAVAGVLALILERLGPEESRSSV